MLHDYALSPRERQDEASRLVFLTILSWKEKTLLGEFTQQRILFFLFFSSALSSKIDKKCFGLIK